MQFDKAKMNAEEKQQALMKAGKIFSDVHETLESHFEGDFLLDKSSQQDLLKKMQAASELVDDVILSLGIEKRGL